MPRPFNPITSEYFFEVQAIRPLPESSWLYEIQYRDTASVVSRTVYVIQWWTAGKTQLAPALSDDEHRSCVLLVDVPQSKDGPRPYYVVLALDGLAVDHEREPLLEAECGHIGEPDFCAKVPS